MAFKSNALLRQNSARIKPETTKEKLKSKKNVSMVDDKIETESVKEENEMVDFIQTNALDDPDDFQYVTVILEHEESGGSDEENIEMVEDSSEMGEHGEHEYVETEESTFDEIPKMSLKRHRNRRRGKEDGNRSLTCIECGKTLSNFSSYKYHMQLHSDDTPFLCAECGEGFKTRNAYDGHLVTHLESNPNKCTECGKTYRQAASLRSHMLTHTGERVLTHCDTISLQFNLLKTDFVYFDSTFIAIYVQDLW